MQNGRISGISVLSAAIHVYEQKKSLEISAGKGGKNHGRRHLPNKWPNTFSARWTHGVAAGFGAELVNNQPCQWIARQWGVALDSDAGEILYPNGRLFERFWKGWEGGREGASRKKGGRQRRRIGPRQTESVIGARLGVVNCPTSPKLLRETIWKTRLEMLWWFHEHVGMESLFYSCRYHYE
jgi:hypothetical protein